MKNEELEREIFEENIAAKINQREMQRKNSSLEIEVI